MIFQDLTLTPNGEIQAVMEGHAHEVMEKFHEVCSLLLSNIGPWRFTEIHGECPDEEELDSKMIWTLTAKLKSQ